MDGSHRSKICVLFSRCATTNLFESESSPTLLELVPVVRPVWTSTLQSLELAPVVRPVWTSTRYKSEAENRVYARAPRTKKARERKVQFRFWSEGRNAIAGSLLCVYCMANTLFVERPSTVNLLFLRLQTIEAPTHGHDPRRCHKKNETNHQCTTGRMIATIRVRHLAAVSNEWWGIVSTTNHGSKSTVAPSLTKPTLRSTNGKDGGSR